MACLDSGTICSSFIFMRSAGIRHSALSQSISVHCAPRNSIGADEGKQQEPKRQLGLQAAVIGVQIFQDIQAVHWLAGRNDV